MSFSHIRKAIFFTYRAFRGYNTLKCLRMLTETQWFSEEKIKEIQRKKLRQLLKHCYKTVPYYRILFSENKINLDSNYLNDEFRKIPLLDKDRINANKEKIFSTKYKRSDLLQNSTSGSTGKKLVFYRDGKKGIYEATHFRNLEWSGVDICDRQTKLWGDPMDFSKAQNLKSKMANFYFPTLFLSSYEMSPKKMNLYTNKIYRFKPKYLTGYTSSLYLFADYLDKKNMDIKGLKSIISCAETFYPYHREKIESVFKCKVFNRYGCREFSSIAQECEMHKGLHINAEHVWVEIIDEDGNPCNPGKRGQIVITDLDNYGFPFIRYKIGDIGIFSDKKCDCGRGLPLLEKVEGRTWDIIVGANGNRLVGSFWLVKGIEGIKQFQIIQEKLDELILNLVVDESFTLIEKQKVLKRINENCGENMKVNIQFVDEIPTTESGKHRFIISKVSPFINNTNE